MPNKFRAFVVDEVEGKYVGGFRQISADDLPAESVLIDIAYSSLNYKDGLAVTGKGKIVRKFPMVPGIDLAGTVAESSDVRFRPGDKVLATGWGLSESTWGGYSERMRVNPDILVKIPSPFSVQQAMAIGTAGYTAMLSIMAMEHNGLAPDQGEVVVTGASGGVGSVAIAVLSKLGYRVVASTGRPELHNYLVSLGATEIMPRSGLDRSSKPLEKVRWAGAIDSVGSKTLATVLAQVKEEGVVAACGLVSGADLPTTVMPFILRGVKLLGINYFPASKKWRETAWKRLGSDLDFTKLESMTEVQPLSNIQTLAQSILDGKTKGRIVIDINA